MSTRTSKILVVANRTALSAGLEEALTERVRRSACEFTLLVPLGRSPEAQRTAEEMALQLRAAGFEINGRSGDTDPMCAVIEEWNPAEYDEIIVSTLPAWKSRWMRSGLPQRIERHTGALVRHIEAREAPAAKTAAA